MHAHMIISASKFLLFGLGGLSTLLSFSARVKFSFLFSFSPSEGVAPPPSGPQVGSVHKSAQLLWAACLPYWHGWWYWHAMTKTCQNVGTLCRMSASYAECWRPRYNAIVSWLNKVSCLFLSVPTNQRPSIF